MSARYIVADVFDGLASLPDGSVDLVMGSPPFLALRSYLPADHPDKAKEIGSEATPGEFLDVLLDVVVECQRVLAPHGSLVFELGDTYAGSGGAGGDYNDGGLREGAPGFDGSARGGRLTAYSDDRGNPDGMRDSTFQGGNTRNGGGRGWPLAKSKVLIPQSFAWALAYGRNPWTGREIEPWIVRNTVAWCRPNPPVGRDGDKFRPATSFLTVACKARDRYWDGDAVRNPDGGPYNPGKREWDRIGYGPATTGVRHPAGAPLLDWWSIPTQPYVTPSGLLVVPSGETCHRVRVPVGALADGIQRTMSPDCPVHGSPDRPGSSAPDGERGDSGQSRTARSNSRPDSAPQAVRPPMSWNNDRSASSDSLPGLAATPHSKPSNRTAPGPATTPAGTPSAGNPDGTGRTSASPASSAPHPDKRASSISADVLAEDLGTSPHTERIDVAPEACTCSHWVELDVTQESSPYAGYPGDYWDIPTQAFRGSHYATYPDQLVVPVVKAMCPARVCRVCGEPSTRITAPSEEYEAAKLPADDPWRSGKAPQSVGQSSIKNGSTTARYETLGWSDCGHDDWRPGVCLDPFAGSGTTLAVATGHGYDAIGIELDPRNVTLAEQRVGMFLSVEYLNGEPRQDHRSGNPLLAQGTEGAA